MNGKSLHVGEIKWKKLSIQAAKAEVLVVSRKLQQLSFIKDYTTIFIEIYDQSFLGTGTYLFSTTFIPL